MQVNSWAMSSSCGASLRMSRFKRRSNCRTQSGGRLGELLVHMGVLEERDLVGALAEFFGMPVADLRRYKPDPDALALISEDVARGEHGHADQLAR